MPRQSLSPLDQIMPRVYSRILLSFSLPQESPFAASLEINKAVARAMAHLQTLHPILAGNVVVVDDGSGRVAVDMPEPTSNERIPLTFRDLPLFPSKSELSKRKAPAYMFDDPSIAPVGAFPDPSQPVPAFAVQVSHIPGGVILATCMHHSVADGTGIGVILNDITTKIRGTGDKKFTSIGHGMPDREKLFLRWDGRDVNPVDHLEYSLSPHRLPQLKGNRKAALVVPFTIPPIASCTFETLRD